MANIEKLKKLCSVLVLVSALSVPNMAMAQSIIRDAEIENVIKNYANPIFSAASLTPSDVNIHIIGDKSINAFVTNGQNVYLNTGLILEAKTPNELKGVIAHETGHIAGGHIARSEENANSAMVPAYVSMVLGIAAIAAGAPSAGVALMASSQQFAVLTYNSYTRVQEASADQAAFQYLETTHQSSEGLVNFLKKFRYNEIISDARKDPYFRSHPLSADRVNALQIKADSSKYSQVTDSNKDIEDLQLIQGKIFGYVNSSQQTFIKYPLTDNSLSARYARAIAYYRMPDTNKAISETSELIKENPKNPYFNELLGQIYFENSDFNHALPYYKKAVDLAPNESLIRIGLARTYINIGGDANLKKAEDNLQQSIYLEKDNAFAWNQMAILDDKLGKNAEARLATAEEAFALGDYVKANMFAKTAMDKLTKKSPSWQRASDIKNSTDKAVKDFYKKGKKQEDQFATTYLTAKAKN